MREALQAHDSADVAQEDLEHAPWDSTATRAANSRAASLLVDRIATDPASDCAGRVDAALACADPVAFFTCAAQSIKLTVDGQSASRAQVTALIAKLEGYASFMKTARVIAGRPGAIIAAKAAPNVRISIFIAGDECVSLRINQG